LIKIVIGTILVLLFVYMFSLLFRMAKVARKEKQLLNLSIDEGLADIDSEIEDRRKALEEKYGSDTPTKTTKETT
jgi:hypothetical protein